MMVEGDKWEMYIPSELAYGDRGSRPKISPGDALVFTMELLKINGRRVPSPMPLLDLQIAPSTHPRTYVCEHVTVASERLCHPSQANVYS